MSKKAKSEKRWETVTFPSLFRMSTFVDCFRHLSNTDLNFWNFRNIETSLLVTCDRWYRHGAQFVIEMLMDKGGILPVVAARKRVGCPDGCRVGCPDGCRVGCLVGCEVGWRVGCPVGWIIGCLVGQAVLVIPRPFMTWGIDIECNPRLAVAAEEFRPIVFASEEFTHDKLATMTEIINEIVAARMKIMRFDTEAVRIELNKCILLLIRALLTKLDNKKKLCITSIWNS